MSQVREVPLLPPHSPKLSDQPFPPARNPSPPPLDPPQGPADRSDRRDPDQEWDPSELNRDRQANHQIAKQLRYHAQKY